VVIPELDFRESARILSLTGWGPYTDTLSLISPIVEDFYCKTAALYPLSKKHLDINWIFDSCIEALGREKGDQFLKTLKNDLLVKPPVCFDDQELSVSLTRFLDSGLNKSYLPLALLNAIEQYNDWSKMNPLTDSGAREQTLFELMELYKLNGFPELVRYYFYRHTYFGESGNVIEKAFDKLLESIQNKPDILPIQLVELSELQYAITNPEDKIIFSRMIFPRMHGKQRIDFLKVGERLKEHLVILFNLLDKKGSKYTQREPIEPREIGQLYQLFFRENYPKEISDSDNHFVVIDDNDKIVGGLTWRYLENNNVLLDGIVVKSSLQGRGIASGMIENFFTSMAAREVKVIKAHFLFGNYYMKHYFKVDKRWGALIKILNE
jgi:predicted GNAT family acetyltransferase